MSYLGFIIRRIEESFELKTRILNDKETLFALERVSQYCFKSLRKGGKIIFAGNGGSFADAQHLAAEFVSRFKLDRQPLAAIALGTNSSLLTAVSNDYNFDQVFARELESIGGINDLFMPLSTSGNSQNILSAVQAAKNKGLGVIALTGYSGGKLAELCDCIKVPSNETALIQECHILLGHIVCEIVEKEIISK